MCARRYPHLGRLAAISRVELRFVRTGEAWREQRFEKGRLREDAGLVSLERVLAVIDRDTHARERALALDPNGAARLAAEGGASSAAGPGNPVER